MLNLFKKKEPVVVKPAVDYIPPEQPEYEDYLELLIDVNKSAYILGKQTKAEYTAMKSALGDILDRAEARRCADGTSELDMTKLLNEQANRDGYLQLNENGVPVACLGENYRKIRDLGMSGWNDNLNLEFCWPPATPDFSREEITIKSDSSPQEKQPL